MILGAVAYAIVVASNLIDSAVVQILANLLVGVGAAILWNAQGVYLGRCALWDSRTSSKSFIFLSFLTHRLCRDHLLVQWCVLLHLPVHWLLRHGHRWCDQAAHRRQPCPVHRADRGGRVGRGFDVHSSQREGVHGSGPLRER